MIKRNRKNYWVDPDGLIQRAWTDEEYSSLLPTDVIYENGKKHTCLETYEVYDPVHDNWVLKRKLN